MLAYPPRKTLFLLAITFGVLTVSFQNFGNVPVEALKLSLKPSMNPAEARILSMSDGTTDIRDLAPSRPHGDLERQVIAVPESGSDLASVGGDWAKRQARLLTEGAEQRLLEDANHWLTQMMSDQTQESDVSQREPAAANGLESKADDEDSVLSPTHVKLTQVNRVEVEFQGRTRLSCLVKGDSMELGLSRSVASEVNLQFKHDTQSAASTVQLNYSW